MNARASPIARQPHDVMHAQRRGHCGRAVAAAVVDHQVFDRIDPGQRPRQRRHRLRQRALLVIAGNLDDALHA
jgi:hypothetical protein